MMAWMMLAPAVLAQKGTGDRIGAARSAPPVERAMLEGTVEAVRTAPCENTTGRAQQGTHLVVETDDGAVDLHLGPSDAVRDVRRAVREGTPLKAQAFRTGKLPDDAWVAITLTIEGTVFSLRHPNTLRPRWSGSGGEARGGRCW